MPKCLVVDPAFTWGDDRPPRTPWNRTVIYECHVRGMTVRHPACPSTCAAPISAWPRTRSSTTCCRLGVTAVELMPVHQFVRRPPPRRAEGLTNYWGYNSIAFFAPHVGLRHRRARPAGERVQVDGADPAPGRARGHPRRRLQPHRRGRPPRADAVAAGHRQLRLLPARRRSARGTTSTSRAPGTASTSCIPRDHGAHHGQPPLLGDRHARRRLPLRPGPGAGPRATRPASRSAFFEIIQQDPVLSQVKLIAEPWDVGPDGYQLGRFPAGLVGVERGVPGLRAPLLAGRPRPGPRAGLPPRPARATSTPRAGGGPTPASTSSPATTASR